MTLTSGEEKELRGLSSRRSRERTGRFLAEGVRVVEDLLASPVAVRWVLAASSLEDSERGRALLATARSQGVPVRTAPDAGFAALAATEHPQGVLAVAEVPAADAAGMLEGAEPRVVLVLDAVQDPGNFGTLVRTAEALGAAGVVVLPGTVDPWNPKAVRAAVGSSFRIPIVPLRWAEAEEWLRLHGFRVLAGAVAGGEVPAGLPRAALVVGNEGAGVSPEVLAGVDATVGVRLRGRAESLNVASAAAILLHELLR
jgi:TrmH family RNA methyltransferase